MEKEGICGFQFSSQIIRVTKSNKMRYKGHVARMGDRKGSHRILVEKSEGSRPLRGPRLRWEDNGTVWISLAQNKDMWLAIVNRAKKLRASHNGENFLTS